MNKTHEQYIPLIVTVGQVVIFPYYIIWLKEASYSYSLFAWLFALFSFAAAFGYYIYLKNVTSKSFIISFVYLLMGFVYMLVYLTRYSTDNLAYIALLLQLFLGFLQGYFKGWHSMQTSYRLHVIHHYVIVGIVMIALSFIKIVSPAIILGLFGCLLSICGLWLFIKKVF